MSNKMVFVTRSAQGQTVSATGGDLGAFLDTINHVFGSLDAFVEILRTEEAKRNPAANRGRVRPYVAPTCKERNKARPYANGVRPYVAPTA